MMLWQLQRLFTVKCNEIIMYSELERMTRSSQVKYFLRIFLEGLMRNIIRMTKADSK
jgi:hypothetical protein